MVYPYGWVRHDISHPPGWMMDPPESLIGEVSVQGSRDAFRLFRVTRFGGIQPARVMRATWCVGVPPPLRALVLNGSQRFQAMPKRFARQGLTHLADAALVPLQARGEQVARDPGTAHIAVGRVCILNVRRAVHRGLSLREGVLAKASAVRPRATPRTQKGYTQTTRTPSRQHAHTALCTPRHATALRHSCESATRSAHAQAR